MPKFETVVHQLTRNFTNKCMLELDEKPRDQHWHHGRLFFLNSFLFFFQKKIFNFFYILNTMVTIAILKYFKNYWHLQFHHNKTVSFSTVALRKHFLSIWQFKHVTQVCGPESEFLQKHNLEYKHQTHQIISLKKSFIYCACLSVHLSSNLSTYISQTLLLETIWVRNLNQLET